MRRKMGKMDREYRVFYYNADGAGFGLTKMPWSRHAYSLQNARQIKQKLENEGYVDVSIIRYDTTMYKIK